MLLAVSGVLVLLSSNPQRIAAVLLLGRGCWWQLPQSSGPGGGFRWPLAGIALVVALVGLAVFIVPLRDRIVSSNTASFEERQVMWSNTDKSIPEFLTMGSGAGSFETLYPRFEDPETITPTYTSHAHNDYLEIALETGVPGILLLIAFLVWWVGRTRSIWGSASPTSAWSTRRAATSGGSIRRPGMQPPL